MAIEGKWLVRDELKGVAAINREEQIDLIFRQRDTELRSRPGTGTRQAEPARLR